MARTNKRVQYLVTEPNWAKLSLIEGEEERQKAYQGANYFIHSEIQNKECYKAFRSWVTKHSGWDKKTQKIVLAGPDWGFLTIGEYAWFMDKTGWMPARARDFIDTKLDYLIEHGKKNLEEKAQKAEAAKQPKLKPARMELDLFIGAVDDSIDKLIENRKGISVDSLFNSLALTKDEASDAYNEFKRVLDEYEELVRVRKIKGRSDWDEQLVEGYSHMSKPATRKIHEFLEELTMKLLTVQERKKVVRRKKPQDPRKLVARLRHLQADKDLNIASINPVDILGSTEVWVYDVKRKRLGLYKSKGDGGLGVKGTSITGYDLDMSYEKTLRKPDEQLPLINKKSKKALHEVVGKIRGKKMKVKTRINPNMLLLKVQ